MTADIDKIQEADRMISLQRVLPPIDVSRLDEMITDLEELQNLLPLLYTVTVGQILDSSEEIIEASGLNPWCVNEGLAERSDSGVSYWRIASIKNSLASLRAFLSQEPVEVSSQ